MHWPRVWDPVLSIILYPFPRDAIRHNAPPPPSFTYLACVGVMQQPAAAATRGCVIAWPADGLLIAKITNGKSIYGSLCPYQLHISESFLIFTFLLMTLYLFPPSSSSLLYFLFFFLIYFPFIPFSITYLSLFCFLLLLPEFSSSSAFPVLLSFPLPSFLHLLILFILPYLLFLLTSSSLSFPFFLSFPPFFSLFSSFTPSFSPSHRD